MSAILDRVKDAVLPNRQPGVDCIAELQRLWNRYVEIGAHVERLLTALSSIPAKERAFYQAFSRACEGDDQRAIANALNDWLEWAPRAEFCRREHAANTALKSYGSVLTKFKAEFPAARDVLVRAVEHRLSEAKERHADVLSAARQRLVPEGFDLDQVADDPQVRRAAGRISHLETVKRRIQNEPLESVWRQMASQLLR